MATFKALNVDSDHESEDEIDNTKEIQIEEALKLYQTALQYHSEGPASWEKAASAYKDLFASEIFQYPESLSEYKRFELYGDSLVFDSILEDDFDAGPVQLTNANESAPSTLPQILHLSYKNHGQFLLQTMEHWIREHGQAPPEQTTSHIFNVLSYFAEALDKEDTDLDLWLRTASVAAILGSPRIIRFCLEAVLDGDDELFDSILRLPGLEDGFAGQQLRELVSKLEDNLSLSQAPLSSMSRRKLSENLKQRLNPYPFAPLPADVSRIPRSSITMKKAEPTMLNPTKWDWAGVGEVILHHFHAEQGGFIESSPGHGIAIKMPPDTNVAECNEPELTPAAEDTIADTSDKALPQPQQDAPAPTTVEVTESPAAVDGDVIMEEKDKTQEPKNKEVESVEPQDPVRSESRKRSTDSAGLPETADGERVRSKRIRARNTDGAITAEPAGLDLAKQMEDKLSAFTHADKCLSEIVNDALERFGIESLEDPEELRKLIKGTQSGNTASSNIDKAACDLYAALQSGASKVAAVMLSSEHVDLDTRSREAGMNAFLGYAKTSISQTCVKPVLVAERLAEFVNSINQDWLPVKEVAFTWLEVLLSPGAIPSPPESSQVNTSSYIGYRWAEDLKRHLVQIIVNFDDFIYEKLVDRLSRIESAILKAYANSMDYELSEWDMAQIEMIEIIFELHLDIYSLIKHPHSGVDANTQISQKDRLERWLNIARDAIHMRTDCKPSVNIGLDELELRHIWASVFQMSVNDEIEPGHVIAAMEELKGIFHSTDGPIIEVQNNAVMPELSIAAVDRELARISMKDFFLKVFDLDEKDPEAVIQSLAPLLEPIQETGQDEPQEGPNGDDKPVSPSPSTLPLAAADPTVEQTVARQSPPEEMRKFLDAASVSLRLSLWQRLREAYEGIEYVPGVVTCYLRSIETLIGEFKASTYQENPEPERQVKLLSRLRIIDEVLVKVLQIVKNDKQAFEYLSYDHLQTSMTTLAELLRIMSAGNMLEDMLRVGQLTMPRFEGFPAGAFVNISGKLHDMQLRAWMLQYYLLKEGITQNREAFPTPSEDQFEFLRHVHYAAGVRGFCHSAGRLFLRLAKDEVLRMDDVIDGNTRDTELAQVLYDLYGLKTFVQPADCQEFSSVPEILDKKTAFQLLPFILSQARKMNIKDLPKTDLKVTIDKVHGALGRPKTNEDISLNRKILTSYFKSPVNPISLFDCLKGVNSLSTKQVSPQTAVAASIGWNFLMGNIALNKFRSQKRLTQGPTEDLNFAQAFFLQDLEYSVDRWETWYRLAQANDTQLEECVSWNADKMNGNSLELINFQRAAIHCYVMGVACAVREADVAPQTIAKVADMYADFGNRIYSSTREPFSMNAFSLRESEQKYYSGQHNQQVYQNVPFAPMNKYTAWKFAGVLFKRAIKGKPEKWWNYYMLGKCQWKMYRENANLAYIAAERGEPPLQNNGPTWEQVVESFVSAIDNLPEKRERGREPILEPHYKLVTIAHKLLQGRAIDHEKGAEIVSNTSYSQNISAPENADDWERYILAVLKTLRTADKSSWHHRFIARHAHIVYDGSNDPMVAYGAKHELSQQMFTKTMTVQVWKPENERPGRHFVYTSRYTRFFTQLLDQTGDKVNMELLAKRVRRKQTDFFEHSKLWQELCLTFLRLLRRMGRIPDGHEDAVFKSLNHDEFVLLAGRLEAWCQDPTTQNPILDVLRDVLELKRLNNGLMKATLIDDLVGDTYAMLYANIGSTLPPLPSEQTQQPPHQQLPLGTPSSIQAAPGQPPISSLQHVQVDGSTDPSNPNLPFSIYHPSQPPGQTQVQPQHPPPDTTARSRAKAIGRREVQRRAEAASAKPATPAPAPSTTTMAIRSPPAIHPQVVIPSRAPNPSATNNAESPTKGNASGELQVPPSGTATTTASVTNEEPSAPASVHDDADDESELSELDESEVREIQEEADIQDPEPPRGQSRGVTSAVRPISSHAFHNEKVGTEDGQAGVNELSNTTKNEGGEEGGDKMDEEL